MKSRMLILLCVLCPLSILHAQTKKKLLERQRKQFELSNYYLSMNMNALLTGYTGLIEYKLDSVTAQETSPDLRARQVFLKSAIITSMSQTAFHSDPLAAAIDTWALCYQLTDYFDSRECREEYGAACTESKEIFDLLAMNFRNGLEDFIDEEDLNGVRTFASNHPIMDNYLNRRSIIYEISDWISEEELRLKSGLLNMNDLMRDLSNQLEYYAATIPKQTMWQLDQRIAEFGATDSVALLMEDMRRMLSATSLLLENSDALIRENRDTLFFTIDTQRRLTLAMLRQERVALLEAMSLERQAVLEALHQEREEAQAFVDQQREAMIGDVNTLSNDMVSLSVASGKEMVDYVFFKLLILTAILGLVIILGIVAYKRL